MKQIFIRHILIVLSVCFLSFGCAKIGSPSGGPRDREIPVITKSVPGNGATDFTGKEIVVTFNEYVVLDNINQKFMVSPPMKSRPEISVRGKSIRIEYEDDPKDSTTYTFYFQDAIRDLNEGNAINNYQFVFSTGPFIDSLSVTGSVYSALNLDPPLNALVLLYSQLADTSVHSQLPDYITRADPDGEFRIDNVRAGTYRLYGLIDSDNSKNYNNSEEMFAFLSEPVLITHEKNYLPVKRDTSAVAPSSGGKIPARPAVTGEYPLFLFQAEKKMHYLSSSSRRQAFQLIYTLSLPPDTLGFEFSVPQTGAESYFIEKNTSGDTITVWLTDSTLYNRPMIETVLRYPFTDSLGVTGLKDDTIQMRYIAPRTSKAANVKRNPYKVGIGITPQMRPDHRIIFSAPVPFLSPDTSRLALYKMLRDERIRHHYSLSPDTSNSCRYFMDTGLAPGSSYLFIADSAAFKGIYGEYSDSTAIRFSVLTPESFGKLILDLKGYEGEKIIQLLDNTEKVIRQTYSAGIGKIEFPLLEKGTYRVRVIFDLNKDRKWTTGDFDRKREPEPVSYYPEEIEIKENWEVVNTWELKPGNSKDAKLRAVKAAPG
jgi:hypothetical protein